MNTADQTSSLEPAPHVDESLPVWAHVLMAAIAFAFWRPPVEGDIVRAVDHWIIMFPVSVVGALILGAVLRLRARMRANKNARYSRAFVAALWIVIAAPVILSRL